MLNKYLLLVIDEGLLQDYDILLLNNIISRLTLTVDHSMKGFPDDYVLFVEAIKPIENHLNNLSDILSEQEKDLLLFRMRIIENPYSVKRREMFHIPFDKRRIVGPQRYSIQGLPCLYLGSSLQACYEEMRRPAINNIHASLLIRKYELEKELKTLHIGYPPGSIAIRNEISINNRCYSEEILQKLAYSYIMCWPFIAACSIVVFERKQPYKPEYIIPQLLLKWIKSKTNIYYGICYFSVHEELTYSNQNYVT
jgi:hypothetical protein